VDSPAGSTKGETRIEELTAAERTVVRRAAESRATVPDLELESDVDMERCLELRERQGCSVTAMLVRACALALREVPRANGAYRDGHFELYSRVNIGLVVSGERSYLVPTIFDADQKSLTELTNEIEELRGEALAGRLASPAFSGATFTLADVGGHGVGRSTVIPNPPQAAAVAAGAIRETAIIREGTVVAGHALTLTLACDHRILYGVQAARFLGAIRSLLEAGTP
jgi:pyruvate dehydrogenase E2 component (dihydrolipoamide acetyltransferase)